MGCKIHEDKELENLHQEVKWNHTYDIIVTIFISLIFNSYPDILFCKHAINISSITGVWAKRKKKRDKTDIFDKMIQIRHIWSSL